MTFFDSLSYATAHGTTVLYKVQAIEVYRAKTKTYPQLITDGTFLAFPAFLAGGEIPLLPSEHLSLLVGC